MFVIYYFPLFNATTLGFAVWGFDFVAAIRFCLLLWGFDVGGSVPVAGLTVGLFTLCCFGV